MFETSLWVLQGQLSRVQGYSLYVMSVWYWVGGGFWWLVAKHLWVIQSEEGLSDLDLARCVDD